MTWLGNEEDLEVHKIRSNGLLFTQKICFSHVKSTTMNFCKEEESIKENPSTVLGFRVRAELLPKLTQWGICNAII